MNISDKQLTPSALGDLSSETQVDKQEKKSPTHSLMKCSDIVSENSGNAGELRKKRLNNEPGDELLSRKIAKIDVSSTSEKIAEHPCVPFTQANDPNQNIDENMMGKAFADNDPSSAKNLISVYGAKKLSESRCKFSFSDKTYPDITPFALACRSGNLEIVERLYFDQKQLNEAFDCENGTNGRTPLMIATMHGHVEVVKQLLEWGANSQAEDFEGMQVSYMNMYFNEGDKEAQIEQLLKEHRKKNDLPQYDMDNDPKVINCPIQ